MITLVPGMTTAQLRTLIVDLQNAFLALQSGNQRQKVRHNERWVEYAPSDMPGLLRTIMTLREQCDDLTGILDFNPAYRVQRGRPARFIL